MHQLVLATDLDGTFLEGDLQAKRFFYNRLIQLKEKVLLVYVTGRPVQSVQELCDQGYLPYPHYTIGDHGSHIVDGTDFQNIDELQDEIITAWNNSNDFLKNMLRNASGLELQPYVTPYRVAYFYNPIEFEEKVLDQIAEAGFDYIQSSEMYLDIVAKGVGKGSSLLKLLQLLKIDKNQVITAGDSLNDLSLFKTGLKSIAVSNAEPKLVDAIQNLKNVYFSNDPGIYGIIDGLRFFNKFDLFSK